MKTIRPYRIEESDKSTALTLKTGYTIVRSEYLVPEKSVYLWIEEPLKVDIPLKHVKFRIAQSRIPVPDEYQYRATALNMFNSDAYHIFEIPEEDPIELQDRSVESPCDSLRVA
jgi:hypothetical protein